MIESTLKIARCCPLVIQGFSNFLGLFQGIMANPEKNSINCIWVLFPKNRGILKTPQNGWFVKIMVPNPIKMDDLGVFHLFLETPISHHGSIYGNGTGMDWAYLPCIHE